MKYMEKKPSLNFNIRRIPFSRFGSYLAFSVCKAPDQNAEGLYLRSVRGAYMWKWGGFLRLQPLLHGRPCKAAIEMAPHLLKFTRGKGVIEICMPEPDLIRVRGRGLELRLEWGQANAMAHRIGAKQLRLQSELGVKLMVTSLSGTMDVNAQWKMVGEHHRVPRLKVDFSAKSNSIWEIALEEFPGEWESRFYPESFSACVRSVKAEFSDWLKSALAVPTPYAKARELAAYISWSGVVRPDGHLKRPGMLMSKNWMHAVWSWDNCFNALALARQNRTLAWDQLLLLVDAQDKQGAFPDFVTNHYLEWGFCKPPIHGWTILRLLRSYSKSDDAYLNKIYHPLCQITEWWFRYRDIDGDGIPEYLHGNDSGWDNCTLFDPGYPAKGPDLLSYMAIQMEALSVIASKLGLRKEAERWEKRSLEMISTLLSKFWKKDHFVAFAGDGKTIENPASLLAYLPIVLAHRLPAEVREKLVEGLKIGGPFLTKYGLASESPRSARFIADGYWRGAIWPPIIAIMVDSLYQSGERVLAREIARRFCNMCAKNGFSENFHALTGKGLRDPAYTWSSSIFLLLASGELLTE